MSFYIFIICFLCYKYWIFVYYKTPRKINNYSWVGITAASDNHFQVSINLILSFFITHPDDFLIYYDLNLSLTNKLKLNQTEKLVKQYIKCRKSKGKLIIKIFNFSLYPKHFTIGNYSWKQVMIYHTLNKYKKLIFWFDAGVELNGSIENEIEIAEKYGFYMPYNDNKLLDWTPVKTSEALHVNRDLMKGKGDGDAGYLVINYSRYMIDNIIKRWVECAYNPMCICPQGASRANSRYEQVTLTLLLYSDEKYKNLVGTFQTFKTHKQQCDHRNDCNISIKYITINENIKNCKKL